MEILDILPRKLQHGLSSLPDDVEELRLRAGQEVQVLTTQGELSPMPGEVLTKDELWRITEAAAGGSLWSCETQLRRGYLSLAGGYRLGICGSVNLEHGEIRSFSDISSLCLRYPRQAIGCAESLVSLWKNGFESTLIIAPPGGGKTTLLRELVRILSASGTRVGLADERGEVAALYGGIPQLEVGPRTDVMDGAPKAKAVMTLLRCMNPEVVALDEVTEEADLGACISCFGCGVKLLATAHGADVGDLRRRRLYSELLDEKIFSRCVLIRRSGRERNYEVIALD
ncbi:MAG: stage III sporulation protein AB [Oscillospiraceae bacterium]